MKTIQEMAREAGWPIEAENHLPDTGSMNLEAFAELVRAEEREEIAEFIENTNLGSLPQTTAMHYALLLKSYANAIRARSNT